VPSEIVDVNSWISPACYPRGSFYPVSHGPSTRYRGITKPYFRICSTRWSCSQAPLCLYTLWQVSILPEGTFGRLRYSLGGDRPSQTTHLALFTSRITVTCETQTMVRVVFHCCLPHPHKDEFKGSHLCYAHHTSFPGQTVVKLHGVFLSCRG
jgi:hypothetical protein